MVSLVQEKIKGYYVKTCIFMEMYQFKELIEEITEGLATAKFDLIDGISIDYTDKGQKASNYDIDALDINGLLSEYFGESVTSVHTDHCETTCVWICFHHKEGATDCEENCIEEILEDSSAVNLYIDMDGTIAEFLPETDKDTLYEKGYFLNLPVIKGSLEGIKFFMKEHPEVNVWLLSAFLADSKWALQEKIMWADKNFPELDKEKQLFVKCGQNKADVIVKAEKEFNFLLDDHTPNLCEWQQKDNCFGVKLINNINGKSGKWKGDFVRHDLSPREFSDNLSKIIINKVKRTQSLR